MAAEAEPGQIESVSGGRGFAAAWAGFGPRIGWSAGVAGCIAGALVVGVLASWAVVTIWTEPPNPSGGLQLSHLESAAAPPAATVTVTIALGSVDLAIEAVRDPADPDTLNLITGTSPDKTGTHKETLSRVAQDHFDNLRIDGQYMANDLRAAPVKVSLTSSRAVLGGTAHRADPLLLGSGTIELHRDSSPLFPYRLVVNVRDYQILNVRSVDATGAEMMPALDQGSAAWDDAVFASNWSDIRIYVAYDPLAHPLTTLRRSPFELVLLPWSLGLGG